MLAELETIDRDYPRSQHAIYGLFDCPVQFAMDILRRKWAVQLINQLGVVDAPIRFNQLERDLAPITQKELTKRLRELEQAGIVERQIYAEVPPRVEYSLTQAGLELFPAMRLLCEWGKKYGREDAPVEE